MDAVVEALAEQQREFAGLLQGLSESGWHTPTRCEGWDVSDVVLHVAQSNELALGSATWRFREVSQELTRGMGRPSSIDDG
ncbi:MAG: maleylpyruvate isomerase N-terminal domain-containing protein, partial [Acidimicrobiales bacterium]